MYTHLGGSLLEAGWARTQVAASQPNFCRVSNLFSFSFTGVEPLQLVPQQCDVALRQTLSSASLDYISITTGGWSYYNFGGCYQEQRSIF